MQNKFDPQIFYKNLSESMGLAAEVWKNYTERLPLNKPADIDPLNIQKLFFDVYQNLANDPEQVYHHQVELYKKLSDAWVDSAKNFLEDTKTADAVDDRRFRDQVWQENPYFKFLKDSYLVYAKWLSGLTKSVKGLDAREQEKLEFYINQYIDAISPSNYPLTNPEVLKATFETNAENLVKGMQNLAEDIKQGYISQTDYSAFEVGRNLAITPGQVVYQNDLIQLIQYEASTKDVYKTPLLFIPAWINKYYIADLRPENSFMKWLTEQGYTVYMISWANPDEQHAEKDFADYMKEGIIAVSEQIKKITGEDKINAIGYCLGGTLLATTLAYLEEKGGSPFNAVTFLTTLLDFSDAGKITVFIDEEQVSSLEKRMNKTGYLDGREMALTFSMLRSNDLIWSFVVNNYLLGKDPFPFDILYWNSDATRMPAKMHSFYLRNMYMKNMLAKKGGIKIDGVGIDLSKIKNPAMFLSTLKDHIAPWQSTFKGAELLQNAKFMLADSGHVAGVVSHPAKTKYPHWVNDKLTKTAEEWYEGSTEVAGSWWPSWDKWNSQFSGKKIPARKIEKSIEPAPGSYVKVKG